MVDWHCRNISCPKKALHFACVCVCVCVCVCDSVSVCNSFFLRNSKQVSLVTSPFLGPWFYVNNAQYSHTIKKNSIVKNVYSTGISISFKPSGVLQWLKIAMLQWLFARPHFKGRLTEHLRLYVIYKCPLWTFPNKIWALPTSLICIGFPRS